jgi:glycosyltransferase involved in cell wall biosynthesis
MRHNIIEVIPNAVAAAPTISPTERAILRASIVGDQTRPVLISVGRLEQEKGYFDLLHAFATLHQTYPSAALVIVGNGRLHAELAAQLAALSLEGHAVLLGERHDVPRLLAASAIYVSSSHWEGLPVAVLEAMAAGLPIVATSVGDLPHVVVDSTGVLVPPREPRKLAMALQTLLDNPAQRQALGAAAQAYVARNYSPEVWFDRLMALYKEVCGSPDRRMHTASRELQEAE